jgi:hypothetical protein
VLCESALIESRYWEVIAVNRAGDRSPHERSDMRVVKTGSDFKTGSTPDIASLIRATVDPGYLLTIRRLMQSGGKATQGVGSAIGNSAY